MFDNVLDLIWCIFVLLLILSCIIICFIFMARLDKAEKEYLKDLDEHDKSVILDYKVNTKVSLFGKTKKY